MDIGLSLGFDLVSVYKIFEEDRKGLGGSFPARLIENDMRIGRWRHDQSENINRKEER